MTNWKLLILLTSGFFIGCQGFVTREGVREQEQKKEIVEKVSTLQKSNADVNNRFSDIESDLREVHGKVEVLENRLSQNQGSTDKSKKATEEQFAEIQKKLTVMQEEISKSQDQIATLASELAAAKSANVAAPEKEKSEKNTFEMGEDSFDKKEWRKAILSYQKFREQKPKDKKVPEAIYKIGVCFQELAMKDEARTFYEELIAKYPSSNEAKKAKVRLKKLK